MPAKVAALKFIEPQLATLVETPPTGPDWLHEIKYDGYRTELIIEQGRARAFTRRGADWSRKYQPIIEAAAELAVESAIVDGEVVTFEDDGRTSIEAFRNAMSSAPGRLVYVAFDLLHLDGKDLRKLPCRGRRERLEGLLAGRSGGPIQFSEHIVGNGARYYDHACELGLEGIVSKRADAP
ncbi:hypothetical protein SAZ10_02590 [Mesorhizobium sp. BAC0120]|uniref:ATP-dependent DNA ligase n=1 Tax=Mesorhizobium sp. BAC0120 TaxID=3090670 RepID=UPI00298C7CD6|nr:hypothetical protein [Mesorhizobium sp. BAC0120]MDW6020645.1 hypothetical protein [Mesorhizobium sp. BAC0120]